MGKPFLLLVQRAARRGRGTLSDHSHFGTSPPLRPPESILSWAQGGHLQAPRATLSIRAPDTMEPRVPRWYAPAHRAPPPGSGNRALRRRPASLGLSGARVRGPRCHDPAPDRAPGLPSSLRRRSPRAVPFTPTRPGPPHTFTRCSLQLTRSAAGRHLPPPRSLEAGRAPSGMDQGGPLSYSIAPRGRVVEHPAAAILASRAHLVTSWSPSASELRAAVIWPLFPFGNSPRGHCTPASIVVVLG
ncbi:hypothetical protein NDU88_007902 [Pleurodeles waltl]|uniref:Uncharacterized protein n=1 Tax=Pleurodeles waltl TaxID=8319 RepID=A0AAV7RTN6_PLEWA|nr:hypothetical protein NDU88_007902 [Pleurodeles waltl]